MAVNNPKRCQNGPNSSKIDTILAVWKMSKEMAAKSNEIAHKNGQAMQRKTENPQKKAIETLHNFQLCGKTGLKYVAALKKNGLTWSRPKRDFQKLFGHHKKVGLSSNHLPTCQKRCLPAKKCGFGRPTGRRETTPLHLPDHITGQSFKCRIDIKTKDVVEGKRRNMLEDQQRWFWLSFFRALSMAWRFIIVSNQESCVSFVSFLVLCFLCCPGP